MKLSGWGNYPRLDCRVLDARGPQAIEAATRTEPSLIARGNGRAYGDAALNTEAVLRTRRHDRILAFDAATGEIDCESGVLLCDLVEIFLPRGWFPPVTPGTKFVTVGGMVASDVHGKNHHLHGSFGRHVLSLDLVLEDGTRVTCGPGTEPELFHATCGGMGLTGVITRVRFRLLPVESAWIRQETLKCPDLDAAFAAFEGSTDWTYTVAWIDSLATGDRLGRSLLMRGEHATRTEVSATDPFAIPRARKRRVPVDLPAATLNRFTVRAFNALYYGRAQPGTTLVDYDRFFYPLDAIADWNRIYGRRGFVQYQCVFPKAASAEALREMLETISGAGAGSFLAVLKLFGPGDSGLLSFPMEGYTLALDFPVSTATFALFDRLDRIVAANGGRLYLAKDARMNTDLLQTGYPRLDRFKDLRRDRGLSPKFRSALSERLGL